MMDLSRRSFLKMLGVAGVVLAAPTELLLPFQKVPDDLVGFGEMRVIHYYDIAFDEYFIRYDVRYRDQQVHVSAKVSMNVGKWDPKDYLDRIHKPAVKTLNNYLVRNNVRRSELIRLPYPPEYEQPEWVNRIILGNKT